MIKTDTSDRLNNINQEGKKLNNRKRRNYTEEFKQGAVRLITEEGYSNAAAARNLGINEQLLSKWKTKSEREQNKTENQRDLESENKRLRKENQRLLMEREILKKAAAFFAKESE